MSRPRPRSGFAQAAGGGRFGGLVPTLGAGSAIQALSALAGLATIPIIVLSLGASSFGVLVVVVSLAPWLTLVDGALYPTTRLLVGESRSTEGFTAPRKLLRAAFRLALRIAAMNAATLVVALVVLPLVALFGSEGVATRGELALAVLGFSLPVIVSGPGGVYLGALEGVGRTVVAALFAGAGPLVALPLTVAVVLLGGDLVPLCAVQGLAVAVPRLCAWVYWHRRPSWDDDPQRAMETRPLRLRLVMQMITLSAAILVQTGLDPVIVASQLGADAAAEFGLASRLVSGALIPLIVITPLFAGNIAAARAAGWSSRSSTDLRQLIVRASIVGGVIGGCVVLLGPPVAQFLGAGEVNAPIDLYLAGGLFVMGTFASAPLYMAFSGPSGLRWSVRLNLVLTTVNVAVSLALVNAVGVSGPLWASAGGAFAAIAFWLAMWTRNPQWLREAHQLSRGLPPANPNQSDGTGDRARE